MLTMTMMKLGKLSFLRLALLTVSCILLLQVHSFPHVVLTKDNNYLLHRSTTVAYGSLHIYDPTGKEDKDEEDGVKAPKKPANFFPGSGQHVLVGNKYVLKNDGTAPQVSSGKSTIYHATPMNHHTSLSSSDQQQPTPPPPPVDVVVKLSPNVEALRRELENYERIAGQRENLFVKVHDYVRIANPTHMQEQAALVMERGEQDLEQYIRQHGALRGKRLQDAMRSVAECVQAVHDSKMVWTEIKSANFVVLRGNDDDKSTNSNDDHHPYQSMVIKGIDLESAVFKRENPIDFSAEAIPPCFAVDFLCGREPQAKMEKSFDIWSTGIVFFKLATGKAYFDRHKKSSTEIAMALRTAAVKQGGQGSLDLNKHGDIDEIMDAELKDLIQSCLKINPAERPTIGEVLQHAFFSKNYD